MLNKKPLNNIIFLDIETTSQCPRFEDLSPSLKVLFLKKFKDDYSKVRSVNPSKSDEELIETLYSSKAPLFAEWGKIICISMLRITDVSKLTYKIGSIALDNEKDLLEKFLVLTPKISTAKLPEKAEDYMCAHAGLLFDFPFMAKRMIINGIELPAAFDFAETKPWERMHLIDTLDVWKFGQYDGAASLDLLCSVFGVKSSKSDMNGADVKDVYWKDKDLKRISEYCEQDVLALASCYLKMKGIKGELTK